MAQKIDLNVAPYYDDFAENKNFHRILFRPGYAVQARELTQLQSILQNQIERFGSHVFQEGSVVIPGGFSINNEYYSVQLATAFAGESVDPSQYYNATSPVTIVGATSGVRAKVIGYKDATSSTQPLLYVHYISSGSDLETTEFQNSEQIFADTSITHTTTYAINTNSATTHTTASQKGTAITSNSGVYFIRGTFVQLNEQTIVLSDNSQTPSARIGVTLNEELVTPEVDESLTDNATGASNFAAKGAHRLKISLDLKSLDLTSTADSDFIEIGRVEDGKLKSDARPTQYSVLGETLARRTFDESGDYTVRPFQFDAREMIDNRHQGTDFRGVYTDGVATQDGGTASEGKFVLAVSPGKAYVKGFEIEKPTVTFKDVNKSRQFENVNTGSINAELGNFVKITNMYGQPDVTDISGETTAYKTIGLFDDVTSTRGTAAGTQIGVARARTIQYDSGTMGNTDAVFRLYLFDIRPFTYLTLNDNPSTSLTANHSNGGVRVKGASSNATGFVFGALTSGTTVVLTNVSGTFTLGEKLIVSDSAETDQIVENSSNADLTVSNIVTHIFSETRSFFMDDPDGGQDFTADAVLISTTTGDAGQIVIDGTDSSGTDSNDNIVLEEDNSTTVALESEKIAKLNQAEKNIALYRLPKPTIKTLLTEANNGASDTTMTIRRQFIATTNSSGAVSFTAGANETFLAYTDQDYTLTVLTAGAGGAANQGDVVDIESTLSGVGTATITISDNTNFGNSAKVKLTATLLKTNITQRIKTTNLSKQVKVIGGTTGAFGTRPTDDTISLGRADAFALGAVFDSEDTSSDASAPQIALTAVQGTFLRGEKITGGTSGAVARVITPTTPVTYYLQNGVGATDFVANETITGASSGATAVVSSVTAGSKVITSHYTLDTGQRDNLYDIARIQLKPTFSKPRGRLLVVFDFFSHSSGSFFTVDSYSDVAGQMGYDDIPTYTATRVDPDEPEPTGEFPLTDIVDFRPTCENTVGASESVATVDTITGNSFDFFHRQFDGTGASTVDTPKPNTLGTADFEFFLSRKALVFITQEGDIKVVEGTSAEVPEEPKELENAMKLASLFIPAYTFRPTDVQIERFRTQRFTMRDIGKLQKRIQNIEYYTNLSLLERNAESFEVTDANGLNRFKSGFVVDNFAGHRVGDVKNKDYQNAMDMEKKELRPKCVMRNASLKEEATSDATRTAAGYQRTGDLITLPYTSVTLSENPYATRTEKVQPVITAQWVGNVDLTPTGDEWFETETAPDLIINVDGNFDAVKASVGNRLGTVWNSWETQWSGTVATRTETRTSGNTIITRAIQTVRSDLRRTGIRTDVVEQIDEESQGTRVISRALIPWVRPRNITFKGQGFLPNTKLYVFFDGTAMAPYVTPKNTTYTSDDTVAEAVQLVSDGKGDVEGTMRIPEYRFAGQQAVPKFKTGEVEFRITSSSTNLRTPLPKTAGQTTYVAKGILETEQETIVATRNARVVQTDVSETTSRLDTSTRVISSRDTERGGGDRGNGNPDPLAQTFLVEEEGGCFVTELDVYVETKDNDLPMWVELRNVVNGYPGAKILPFGRKLLQSSEINTSSTAATATTFTFDAPVYLKQGAEYCFVLRSNSLDYKVWISRMGETDIGGLRIVSKQPHLGVLFKSQNNRTWTPSDSEDLKFTLRKASFNTTAAGNVTLVNNPIGEAITNEIGNTVYVNRLKTNPLIMTNGSTTMKVKHDDHGMYSTSNNVVITGVNSGIETTLGATISASATSLTLSAATNFPTGNITVKIGNEIITGSLSGTTLSSLTRGAGGSTAVGHTASDKIELYQILGTPLTEINKEHTSIANIGTDYYTIALTTAPTITGGSTTAEVGGTAVYASENYRYETIKTALSVLELPTTTVSAKIRNTTATSPSGSESSFQTTSLADATTLTLNENNKQSISNMVASQINETNELAGANSLFIPLTLGSNNANLSPVIDADRLSAVLIANKMNSITGSSGVFPTTDYVTNEAPDGDQNAFIYITKKVALESPATAIKVIFSAHKHNSADIKCLFKTLRSDDASDFDELGYTFFNTTGTTDVEVGSSLEDDDFQEYVFTAGVTDDGIGTPLPEFIQFAIKIVGQGTNAAEPIRIKDFRALALAT
tara:strand:+ start:1736 stop:8107 length:6372 start_codon:yes stop_codon:yes gene_type:complete